MAMSPGRTNSPLATHVTLEGLSVIASTPPHFLFSPPDSIPKRGRPKQNPYLRCGGSKTEKWKRFSQVMLKDKGRTSILGSVSCIIGDPMKMVFSRDLDYSTMYSVLQRAALS